MTSDAPYHAPAPAPAVIVAGDATDTDLTHLYCCKPNRGLCGSDLTGKDEAPDAEPVTCTLCDAIDEAGGPCGARFCRLRQWARQWFGRPR